MSGQKSPKYEASFMERGARLMLCMPKSWNIQTRTTALALFFHSNENGGGIYAGINRLMAMTGLSRSGLLRCLQFLVKGGFLSNDGKHVHENGVATTLRRLNLEAILAAGEAEENAPDSPTSGTSATEVVVPPVGPGVVPHVGHRVVPRVGHKPRDITKRYNQEYIPPYNPPMAHEVTIASKQEVCVQSPFDAFWEKYPRKVSKPTARKAWERACKRASPEQIIQGLERYQFSAERKYIPHPSTWLNGDRWNDTDAGNAGTLETVHRHIGGIQIDPMEGWDD